MLLEFWSCLDSSCSHSNQSTWNPRGLGCSLPPHIIPLRKWGKEIPIFLAFSGIFCPHWGGLQKSFLFLLILFFLYQIFTIAQLATYSSFFAIFIWTAFPLTKASDIFSSYFLWVFSSFLSFSFSTHLFILSFQSSPFFSFSIHFFIKSKNHFSNLHQFIFTTLPLLAPTFKPSSFWSLNDSLLVFHREDQW